MSTRLTLRPNGAIAIARVQPSAFIGRIQRVGAHAEHVTRLALAHASRPLVVRTLLAAWNHASSRLRTQKLLPRESSRRTINL